MLSVVLGCGGSQEPPAGPVDPQRAARTPRNILLISLDDLRADHLGSYGYTRPTSPFLDQLASGGTRFSQAFVNTHGTPPSHTTLFTSLYQESHRVGMSSPGSGNRNDAVPRGLVTLTELLNEAGYRTLAVTGGGYMGKSFGQDQGFEHFFVDNPSSGVFHRKTGIEWQVGKVLEALGDAGLDDGRPIFAFLHTYEIHSPYESKPPFEDLYGHYDSRFVPTSENLKAARQRGLKTLEDQDLAAIEAAYDRGIRYTDEWLKQLIAGLRASGFLDDSLIVISADHGEEFGEHGALLHPVSLFDELLHVPLIMVGPGVPVAVSDPRMVSTVDVAPTILSLVGVDVPSFMQGRALFESDDEWHEDQAVFSQYRRVLYSVRTARWKLIKRRGAAPKLFDLRFDPRERKDMAKGHRDVVAELSTRLEEWRRRQPTLKDLERSTAELSEEEEQQLRALGYN